VLHDKNGKKEQADRGRRQTKGSVGTGKTDTFGKKKKGKDPKKRLAVVRGRSIQSQGGQVASTRYRKRTRTMEVALPGRHDGLSTPSRLGRRGGGDKVQRA